MARTEHLEVGAVFAVPLDDLRCGIGQVLAEYRGGTYYLAIFESLYPSAELPSPDKAVQDDVLFLALSMDAKIHCGDWQIIGQHQVAPNLPLPEYKERVGTDQFDVVDHSGNHRRRASKEEAANLPVRKVVAPVRLEKALRAHYGLEPWVGAYDDLRANR